MSGGDRPTRVLMVCLGNICRSPTAEAVFRGLVHQEGLDGEIEVESAGTGEWHVGHPPDERSVAAAAARGVDLTGVARQVDPADFEGYDFLVAMDRSNRDDLLALAPSDEAAEKVKLLRTYGNGGDGEELDVPDPYYGGESGFADVVQIVERGCEALLEEIRAAR